MAVTRRDTATIIRRGSKVPAGATVFGSWPTPSIVPVKSQEEDTGPSHRPDQGRKTLVQLATGPCPFQVAVFLFLR